MKDIDFDELDRAVSSVLTSKDKKTDTDVLPIEAPVSSSADKRSSEPVVSEAAPKVSDSTALSGATPSQSVSPSPAIRRSGRFMDVVHPSSAMSNTPPPKATPAVRRPIVPLSDDVKPEPKAEVAAVAETTASYPTLDTLPEESTPRTEVSADEETSPDTPKESWPDPLDVTSDESKENTSTDEEPEKETDELDELVTDDPVEEDTEERLQPEFNQTPFLTDTKVDKRPLGAFAGGSNSDEIEPLSSADSIDPEDVSASNPDVPTVLPHELDAEVMALDSNESEPEVEPPSAPEKSSSSHISAPTVTSIPQQYKADNGTADTSEHSVFDTSSYHQPLLPQKTYRHNRTWVWALLVIGLLAVGAGLGALWFMAGY